MVKRQTQNAINILELLLDNVKHLQSKWGVYQRQAYLFETSSFELTIDYIEKLIYKIKEMQRTIEDVFSDKYNENSVLELENDSIKTPSILEIDYKDNIKYSHNEMNIIYDDSKHQKQQEILFCNPDEKNIKIDDFLEKLITIDDLNWNNIYKISSIKNDTYLQIENISDLINALDFNFRKRIIGIDTTEIGTELDTRSFGNIQIIYNAAETLMHDYVTSMKGVDNYNGQVVFGFRNRAIRNHQIRM